MIEECGGEGGKCVHAEKIDNELRTHPNQLFGESLKRFRDVEMDFWLGEQAFPFFNDEM